MSSLSMDLLDYSDGLLTESLMSKPTFPDYFQGLRTATPPLLMYTCMGFWIPTSRTFCLYTFWIDLGCLDGAVGTSCKFSLFKLYQKWKTSNCSNFWSVYMRHMSSRYQNDSLFQCSGMGHLAVIFVWMLDFQIRNIFRSECDRQLAYAPEHHKLSSRHLCGRFHAYLSHRAQTGQKLEQFKVFHFCRTIKRENLRFGPRIRPTHSRSTPKTKNRKPLT